MPEISHYSRETLKITSHIGNCWKTQKTHYALKTPSALGIPRKHTENSLCTQNPYLTGNSWKTHKNFSLALKLPIVLGIPGKLTENSLCTQYPFQHWEFPESHKFFHYALKPLTACTRNS